MKDIVVGDKKMTEITNCGVLKCPNNMDGYCDCDETSIDTDGICVRAYLALER